MHPDTAAQLVHPGLNYVVDCIDSIAPKQQLLITAAQQGIRVVSSMGAGGRLDPSRVQVAELSDTFNDSFAANIRSGLRKRGGGMGPLQCRLLVLLLRDG